MGMKPDEREDWTGVRMQLIRIFQQEQFIFPKVDRNEEPTTSGLAFYGGTKDPKALVKRILFKIDSTFETRFGIGDRKRTIIYDPSKISAENIAEKAHCIKLLYNRKNDSYMGFIQLKDYMKLSEVADILGAGPPTDGPVKGKYLSKNGLRIEACEVRGRTEDIFNAQRSQFAASIKKSKSIQGQTKWGACNEWFQACRSSSVTPLYQKDKATKWTHILNTRSSFHYFYDDEPCFNLVSGIMQAREDISQKNSIRTLTENTRTLTENSIRLQSELEEEKRENRRNRAMVQDLYRILVKRNILPDEASTASEESFISTISQPQSRAEGELPEGQQIHQGEASSVDASNDGPVLD